MTRNQIDYARLQEEKRANRARETETHRANTAQEFLTSRRDVVSLGIQRDTLSETKRKNLVSESQQARSLDLTELAQLETKRSNLAREEETKRSNIARETETTRHNVQSEAAERVKASAAMSQASAAHRQAAAHERDVASQEAYRTQSLSLGYAQLGESKRHSQAVELETQRSNLAKEGLTASQQTIDTMNATTRRMEAQTQMKRADIEQDKAEEQRRHNKVTETQKYMDIGVAVGKEAANIVGKSIALGLY